MKSIITILYSFLLLVAFGDLPNLPPGESIFTNGTTFAACPEVGGTILRDQSIPFEVRGNDPGTVLLTGILQDRVIQNSDGNIVFSSRVRDLVSPNGAAWISRINYHGFQGLTIGANYRTDGLGEIGPRLMLRSSDGDRLTANHAADFITPPDEQRFVNFVSTESEFGLGGKVEIFVNNDLNGQAFPTTIYGTASRKVNLPTAEEIRPTMPQVILNDTVYKEGDAVTAEVHFTNLNQIDHKRMVLVFGGPEGAVAEMEMVRLISTEDPLVYVTENSLEIQESAEPVQTDQKISLEQGELFVAMISYEYFTPDGVGYDGFTCDWGSLLVDAPVVGKVELREGLVLTDDELNPVDGAKPIGTLFVEGEVGPVQVASGELLFFPKDEDQLVEFLARTKGVISGFQGHPGGEIAPNTKLPKAGEAWFTISMAGDPDAIPKLPQLRALVGEERTLSVSNQETLALIASAMDLWSEGFLVGLNPRMQWHGDLTAPEHSYITERADSYAGFSAENPLTITNPRHGVRQSWAFLEMFDFAEASIPVGVIDTGFAANPDTKTDHPLYLEHNLSNNSRGPGSVQTPQEVGNSGFGDKKWHGNATVTTISGVLGNNYGTAGIAAQTAVPKLYHMGLRNFALGFGSAIQLAVDDGCSVINISAGYPCKVLSFLGNDDICTPAGRAIFAAKLSFAVRTAALAACAVSPVLDFFVPGSGAAFCLSAVAAAEATSAALFSSIFLGDTRGPVERGVAYATARGVPIVASTGNRLSADTLGVLAPFVDYEESNLDRWQIIPAVIPDVIAVGACYPADNDLWDGSMRNFYANLHFWGDSVDIWAPIYHYYWAPIEGDVDPTGIPAGRHRRREFGGTSCAAPFITGVIANMMAVDPSLDRRFADSADLPSLPGRIRDFLVTHAYQAGDPEAPDSADDRVLYERNEAGVREVIPMPAALVTELERRRNYVNQWGTLRELARANGLLEYETLGYHEDLGREDRFVDAAPTDGTGLPTFPSSTFITDELGVGDRDLVRQRTGSQEGLYTAIYNVTIPARENPDNFLMNGARGSLVSTTADEHTLAWESGEYWNNESITTLITGSDMPYRIAPTFERRPAPDPDRYDEMNGGNNSITNAAPESGWISVNPKVGMEVEAWELCIEDLNFHNNNDRDFFRIDFTEELGVPIRCAGAINPWITINVVPRNSPGSAISTRAYSRVGGVTETLRTEGGGANLKIDCPIYVGKLPLYVGVECGSYLEYDLKIRWSKPDPGFASFVENARGRHAEGEDMSEVEAYLPPIIPQLLGLHGGYGAIPDELVNPNPAVQQPLDSQGRFFFARLIEVNVSAGEALNGILAHISAGESLRMELFDTSGQLMASAGTSDHGFKSGAKSIGGEVDSLVLEFPKMQSGTYFLSLSGHRPGDRITLFPSRSLLGKASGISMEEILDGTVGTGPAHLPYLTEFGANAGFSSLRPAFAPGSIDLKQVPTFSFLAKKEEIYQAQLQGSDGVWRPYQSPTLGEDEEVSFVIDVMEEYENVRVQQLGSGEKVLLNSGPTNQQLLYQTLAGVPVGLHWSPNLKEDSWEPYGDEGSFTGDGALRNWFFEVSEGSEKGFFRIEEE